MRELLTIPEVQAILKCGRSTAYGMAERGELPIIKVGALVRIPKAEFEAWLQAKIEQPKGPVFPISGQATQGRVVKKVASR